MRRGAVVLVLLLAGLVLPAAAQGAPPTPEPNFATTVVPAPCTAARENPYEVAEARADGWKAPGYERYPGACQRLRFSYGPIVVKPGQNDVMVQPVTIEKPVQDGWLTRFAPDLVFEDGSVPPIEQVHLHHAVWLSEPSYGQGPFAAAGEEKTIFNLPRGFGLPIRADDTWLLLYMVHSAVAKPMSVFITYEVDFIPAAKAAGLGLRPAHPVWLDVRPGTYPVFNVQRGYGSGGRCTWPRQECAAFDPFGRRIPGQGMPANVPGTDHHLRNRLGTFGQFEEGTLIWGAGHLHPGGLANEIDLVRPGQGAVRIYTGDAVYWDRKDPTRGGGPPSSWDFSMPVVRSPRWGIRVRPGDVLRSNAAYDTTMQSTYEDMGIVVLYLAPDVPGRAPAPGLDPFAARADPSPSCASGGLAAGVLCDKGTVTHGHLRENDNFGGPEGELRAERGRPTDRVDIAGFVYAPGDLTMVSMTGIPTVRLGSTLAFANEDAVIGVYHTATSCSYPCTGPTGTAFPLADGRSSRGRPLDFDSNEMGYGIPSIGPAKQDLRWSLPVTREAGFRPGEVITYFCRIHPSMRGAFEVTA